MRLNTPCCLLFTVIATMSGTPAAAEKRIDTGIGVDYLYGSLDGYLQTPAGGQPGTTSSKRPTFDELGFDTAAIVDVHASAAWGRHQIRGGAQFIRQSGSATLSEDLVSQNQSFAAGAAVKSDIKTDWYRLNYRYRLNNPGFLADTITLSPAAGIVWFDFHYQLKGDGNTVDREYSKIGYRLGGELEWHPADRWSMTADAYIPLPVSNTPEILTLAARGQYEFWRGQGTSAKVLAGLAYEQIDYEDNQGVPNHVRLELGPLLTLGIHLDF